MSDLKPCPDLRCGNNEACLNEDSSGSIPSFSVVCGHLFCDCRTDEYGSRELAIKAWNNRSYENKLKSEAVREAINKLPDYYKGADPKSLLGGCEKHFIDYVNKLEEEL